MPSNGSRILIVVQNLPVPTDRRVWLECQALRDAGYTVSVICPQGPGDPGYQCLDGVHLYKYRAAPATRGVLSYLVEFVYCWLRTAALSMRVRRERGFDVLQACNPPDTYWLLARLWRPFGVRFVFDQHDLNPELYRSRFGEPRSAVERLQYRGLIWLERRTYAAAHHVIVTNESYRHTACTRGDRDAADVTIVRSGPDTTQMRPLPGVPELRRGAEHLLVYIGIIGPQDNVDVLVRVMDHLVNVAGRQDVHLAILGFGDALDDVRNLTKRLNLQDRVTFTGRADQQMIADHMSTASIGLCPDLKTPLNDASTHNKVMEYMAYLLPVVAFDLTETRVSAGDAAVYVPSGDTAGFAEVVHSLLDDPQRRADLGQAARRRCVAELDWQRQIPAYLSVFDRLTGVFREQVRQERWPLVDRRADQVGLPRIGDRIVVDLRDPRQVQRFALTRSATSHTSSVVSSSVVSASVEAS